MKNLALLLVISLFNWIRPLLLFIKYNTRKIQKMKLNLFCNTQWTYGDETSWREKTGFRVMHTHTKKCICIMCTTALHRQCTQGWQLHMENRVGSWWAVHGFVILHPSAERQIATEHTNVAEGIQHNLLPQLNTFQWFK